MPILWPLKVPERGNAITQRKTLEIEHSCLFIHHTVWICLASSGSHFNKLERVLETPKNGFVSTVTLWITLNKTNSKTRLFVLYSQNYAARALPILFNIPKKSLLKSSYPKKYLPNFRTPKNPGIENFKPKKILRSSLSLEIPSTPPGCSSPLLAALLNMPFLAEKVPFSYTFSLLFHSHNMQTEMTDSVE